MFSHEAIKFPDRPTHPAVIRPCYLVRDFVNCHRVVHTIESEANRSSRCHVLVEVVFLVRIILQWTHLWLKSLIKNLEHDGSFVVTLFPVKDERAVNLVQKCDLPHVFVLKCQDSFVVVLQIWIESLMISLDEFIMWLLCHLDLRQGQWLLLQHELRLLCWAC